MANNDFDFEKEYGFDPSLLDDDDFDFTKMGVDSDYDAPEQEETPDYAPDDEQDASDEFVDEVVEDDEDEDLTSGIDFKSRRPVAVPQEPADEPYEENGEDEVSDEAYPEDEDDTADDDYIDDGDEWEEDEEEGGKRRFTMPQIKLPHITIPPVFARFKEYYLAPLKEAQAPAENTEGRPRRRRKTKAQIFREVYLPAIIAGIALVMILVCIVGSVSNAFKVKKIKDEQRQNEIISASNEAQRVEEEYERILKEAEVMASGYDYSGAITLLDSFTGDKAEYQQAITQKRSEYVNAESKMVEFQDASLIPNLSFHCLIADPSRAFSDAELGGKYNRNFVTTEEFSRILDQLYQNGYVLVDFNSFISSNTGLDGTKSYFMNPIRLPEGKKPVMITETLTNYFSYMIDSNDDGVPDAGGAGFASKLVVDSKGDIKAEMVDTSNQTQIGNFDLVPILEDFIKSHPDFSYRGARATIAATGKQGVFGYRINTSYVQTMGAQYQENEIVECRKLVEALREKGYTIACNTYDNIPYKGKSVAQIQADIQSWINQIKPVVGDVEVLVFAQASDLDDYTGAAYQKLHESGFNIFVTNGTEPKADVNASYVRQSRLMVTGNAMGWYSSQFNGLFDCNVVLDMASRKNIPNG